MRVVFVQKFVPHYRLPFFERVRSKLADSGIEFVLLYCEPDPYENSKVQMVYPDWGIQASTRHFSLLNRYLYWGNIRQHLQKGDIVIVEHAAKLIDNYWIFALRQLGYLKMGYFGHGQNFQATTEYALSAFLKKLMLKRVDHWFAYTEMSRQSLLRQSVDESIVTVVNNTLVPSENTYLGDKKPNRYSCIYIGGLYSLKLLPLLIEAGKLVHARLPEFKLHIVGEGPDKEMLEEASRSCPWLTVEGGLYGIERDSLLAQCNAILMPGLVGLIAVDAFQFKRPIITSDAGEHSPEFAYLSNETNCLIDTSENVTAESYANVVSNYLTDENLQEALRKGCEQSAQQYSIDNMAENFCRGIISKT